MTIYIVKRIFQAIIVILFVTCITFILMNLIPGGPFLSEKAPNAEVIKNLESKYGLDKPTVVQLKNYLVDLSHGDMGISYKIQKNRNVTDIISETFPISLRVGAIALLWSAVAGIALGCVSAYYKDRRTDKIVNFITSLGTAVPSFVFATVLLIIFCVKIKLLPSVGLYSASSYILPCFALGFFPMCYIARLERASMADELFKDYIKTAKAKGLKESRIIFKHALKNAIIPVLSYLGPLAAGILTGGIAVESIFNIPGLGKYFILSITARDYPLIMGTTIFFAAFIVLMTLITDIICAVIDPRINFAKGSKKAA
ncbi:MAG: ABC transporter permease [Eubacteriaceae bacterium]|nr:ABC transporter permease [Eubacteriaceae bacterium]